MNKRGPLWGVAAGVAGTLLVLLIAGLIVVYTGSYNVAAREGHTPFVRWAFDTTMRNAVENGADGMETPEFTPAMVAAGAREYKAMCEHCHAGPGVERAEWAEGLLPHPPHLTEAATQWTPAEIHWIVDHGIKMTAMPAFGPTHDEQAIWNIAAFVSELPAMTPARYRSFGGGHGHGGGDEDHGATAAPTDGGRG